MIPTERLGRRKWGLGGSFTTCRQAPQASCPSSTCLFRRVLLLCMAIRVWWPAIPWAQMGVAGGGARRLRRLRAPFMVKFLMARHPVCMAAIQRLHTLVQPCRQKLRLPSRRNSCNSPWLQQRAAQATECNNRSLMLRMP
jgi:hypothetical protein